MKTYKQYLIKSLLSIAFISCLFPSLLQAQQVVTYLDKRFVPVAQKDSAAFVRIIKTNPGDSLFSLLEQYISGEPYRAGKATVLHDKPSLEGEVVTYQKNGKKISVEHYVHNQLVGPAQYFYRNGQLKDDIEYLPLKKGERVLLYQRLIMHNYYDSLGVIQVKDGNGFAKIYTGQNDMEEGNYKNGYKDGLWKGSFLKGKYHFEETYENGQLTSGNTTDSLGRHLTTYTQIEEQPEYPGGLTAFYGHIGRNFRYTAEAKKEKVVGSVLLSFVIDTTGRPTDIKVLQDLGYGTGEEGMAVVRSSKNWNPGKMRGIPVRVSYTVPIRLNIQSRP